MPASVGLTPATVPVCSSAVSQRLLSLHILLFARMVERGIHSSMKRRTLLKTLSLAAGAQLGAPSFSSFAAVPADNPGPELFFNQMGYPAGATKIATVRGAAPGQTTFRVRQAEDNRVLFEGSLRSSGTDAASGDHVQQADFSSLRQHGSFRLEMGGQGSGPFPIAERPYADALRLTVRGYTGQRCGCAVDLGGGYRHPACHLSGSYGSSAGRGGSLPNHGGWHDAGDYGRYIVNSGITCGTLLWAWELYPDALRELQLGIPSSGNLPDFLAEVLWNLNWMLQLQDPDGGVFHKQTSDHFCGFIMPQDDGLPSHVIGTGTVPYKSTAATADFAAVMAIAARCFAPFHRDQAARFLAASRLAWGWASAHPDVIFRNPPGVSTGEYGDPRVADEFLWASAELWRTTAEPQYEQAFLAGLPAQREQIQLQAPSWGGVASMAYWTYLLAPRQGDAGTRQAIQTATRAAAQRLLERSRDNGYGNTLELSDYTWGSNGTAANQSLLLAIAHHLAPHPDLADAALANLHYMLGRNCFGVSWVTQLGTRPFMHPHHRPSAADGIVAPWPGLLSGGPNHGGGDPVANALRKGPPMRMWVDDERAYSVNEIAINWNAPLVFLLAFANSEKSRG